MALFIDRKLVPPHIEHLKPYVPGMSIADIKERYNPPKIAKLGSNENQLGCSPKAIEAAKESLTTISNYPDPAGKALCGKLAEQLNIDAERIILGNGSNGILHYMSKTFFGAGDEAITASGTFVGFLVAMAISDIPVTRIPLTTDYRFDLEGMLDAISDHTRMIYIANPNNPTGTYVTTDEFEQFMEQVPEHVLVVMDEAYFEYADHVDDCPNALDYDFENLIVMRTFSKAYGLAGLRIGYCVAHPSLIEQLFKVKPIFSPSATAQAAAFGALGDPDFLAESIEVVKEGRNRLYGLFDAYDVTYFPSQANSVMIRLEDNKAVGEMNEKLLKKGVIVRPLAGFGLPDCIRISIGTREDMDHFEESFRAVVNEEH